ncbi:MAG: cyclic nucleotide-binding domain-containing protein [Comamonadaceae bacterium]|nr:cyclic nucleotide-binding domain-containing protein [Comamonadaceae bacterium]
MPTFAKLDPARLKLLAFTSRALRFAPGDMLIRAGDPSDSAFVILEGTVEFLGGTGEGEFVIGTGQARTCGDRRDGRDHERAAHDQRARAPITCGCCGSPGRCSCGSSRRTRRWRST